MADADAKQSLTTFPGHLGPDSGKGPKASLERIPNLSTMQFGHEQVPIANPSKMSDADRERHVSDVAGRLVQSQVNHGSPGTGSSWAHPAVKKFDQEFPGGVRTGRLEELGEKFYPHDFHGAAVAHAAGYNYDDPETKALRRTGGHEVDLRRDYGNVLPEHQIRAYNDFHGQLASYRERNASNPGVARYTGRVNDITARTQNTPEFSRKLDQSVGVLANESPQTGWELNVQQGFEARDMDKFASHAAGEVRQGRRPAGGVKPDPGKVNPHGISMDNKDNRYWAGYVPGTTKAAPERIQTGRNPDGSVRTAMKAKVNSKGDAVPATPDMKSGVKNVAGIDESGKAIPLGRSARVNTAAGQTGNMALHADSAATLKQSLGIMAGDDPEQYVRTDPVNRVKIGSFRLNGRNPYDVAPPGTRQYNEEHGLEHRPFGTVSDSMAYTWGIHASKDSRVTPEQADAAGGSPKTRFVTSDFRHVDVANGITTATSQEKGVTPAPRAANRQSEAKRYDIYEEGTQRATDYTNLQDRKSVV